MRPIIRSLPILLALLLLSFSASAQSLCNANGNLVMFANYDGGVLNIVCDQNIPNLKIGVCTYEPVTINISGAYAGNVTEVRYAGYVSTNNFHCNNSPATTTITGVPSNITSVNFLPPATLSNPNGYSSIVCAYSCPTTSSQGGCNTSDQVVDYFQTTMNAAMRTYYTQYGCWSGSYATSSGGNCCPNVPPPGCNITVNAGQNDSICAGNSTQLNGSSTGASTYAWSPASGLSCTNCASPTASPSATTSYVLTVTDGGACIEMDTVTITVIVPQVSSTPFSPICESATPLTLTGGSPGTGSWTGTGVSGGVFDPYAAGPGVHVLSYVAVDAYGCIGTSTQPITVLPAPVVVMPPFSPLCEQDSPITLSGATPTGGSYAGPGVANGIFVPSAVGPGTYSIFYSYTDSNGCSNSTNNPLVVNANPPAPSISQAGSDSLYASAPADSFSWFLNGTPYPGNSQGIQSMQNGSYSVIAWINGCPSPLSTVFPFEYVGISDGQNLNWLVFPNPATGRVKISGQATEFSIRLFDLYGRAVLSGSTATGGMELELRDLAGGQYFLEISTQDSRTMVLLLHD